MSAQLTRAHLLGGPTEHYRSRCWQEHHLNSLSQQAGLLMQTLILGGALGNPGLQLLQICRQLGSVGLRQLCLVHQQRVLPLQLINLQASYCQTCIHPFAACSMYSTHALLSPGSMSRDTVMSNFGLGSLCIACSTKAMTINGQLQRSPRSMVLCVRSEEHCEKTDEHLKRQVCFLSSHLEVAHLGLKCSSLLNPAVPDAPSTLPVRDAPSDLPAITAQGTHESLWVTDLRLSDLSSL